MENPETNAPAEMPAPEAVPAVARIVGGAPRDMMVPLAFPIEFDGKTWEELRVRRVTGVEISNYMEALARKDDPAPLPPTFDFPRAVYEALDDDDLLAVEEAAFRFLPRRLRARMDAVAFDQPAGGDT